MISYEFPIDHLNPFLHFRFRGGAKIKRPPGQGQAAGTISYCSFLSYSQYLTVKINKYLREAVFQFLSFVGTTRDGFSEVYRPQWLVV